MRIKKIELIGFKSFKDRTVIHFDAGITGVVGPNGCGKSNIVDALVWVMGEMSAKDLRGSAMTDVIFAGAEGYAPSGMAEVSLTLENDGGPFPVKYLKHSEIMVTRRLHRSGDSEYFVNKEPARLRDIQEIFMDTGAGAKGFSIIQQGMIGKIITAKPEDRRMLIEEAAGVTKFKMRKRESQRKLQATDQNLVRLQDIIGELKRQIDSLQRQAQRAERYRSLKSQIEVIDLWVTATQYQDLKSSADECQRILLECQNEEIQSGTSAQDLGAQLEQLRLQLLEQEKSLDSLQEETQTKQASLQKRELEIQELKFEIEQARRNEQMTGNLVQEQAARQELLKKDETELLAQVQKLAEEKERFTSEFNEKNEIYQNSLVRVQEVDQDLTNSRRELFALGQTESAIDAKLQALQSQSEELADKETHEREVHVELQTKLQEFAQRRERVYSDLESERQMQMGFVSDAVAFEENKKQLQVQLQEKKIEVDEFKDKLNEVASRLYGLENLHSNFEGFEEGVKAVMLWQKAKERENFLQPVSEVVEVPADYEMAMEAALGSRLQTLLTPDQDFAVQAVSHLKSQKSGRSSFYLGGGESLAPATTKPEGDGVRAILKEVVRMQEELAKSVGPILDRIAVVDTVGDALRLRPVHPGWSFVTMEGDTLSQEGVLTGGSSEGTESGVLKRRREIKELSALKGEWAGKLALAQAALKKIEEQLNSVTQDFEAAQKRKIDQEIRVAELRKDLERAQTELENSKQATERQQREILKIQDQSQQLQGRIEELEADLLVKRERKAELESQVEELQSEHSNLRLSFDGLQNQVSELRALSASKTQEHQSVSRELDRVQRSLSELGEQLNRMSAESSKNATVMSESQILLEQRKLEFEKAIVEVEALRATQAQAKNDYEVVATQVRELTEQSQQSQKIANERQHRMNEAQLKFEQAKLKEQYIIDQIRERYMLNLPDIYQNHLKEGNPAEAEGELKELREKLGKIGEVNLSAIEEYEETAKRYEFLLQQQTDLNEAKEQLRRVIDRINRICGKRFKETFDLVNDRFQKVFPVLFGGGEARLELIEDPEKDEVGIEIIAKPPGKKMQSISLLSGGEKALTAVSLVFSIFLVKPSPYCLLDEVDAPLDDANVFRFNDLVREMAKRSQIIVVTHNKHTMEVAAKLYGVTMQERGVSTMVSVNLQDIQ